MAGECLSYGAFGAYSAVYNRYKSARPVYSYYEPDIKPTHSWKTFLPDVTDVQPDSDYVSDEENRVSDYDHALHAGIKNFNPEVTWVVQRYTPLDERPYAPVPRYKYISRHDGVPPPRHWIPPQPDNDPKSINFSRRREEKQTYRSTPSTRDEKWSTLREMLPSRGHSIRAHPPDWGSRSTVAPRMSSAPQRRFPIINSPMSRFVSDMHLTNREFKLF